MTRTFSAFILLLAGMNPVTAHHGLGTYDTSQLIEFTGKVVEFRLMDPHSVLVVEASNPDGTVTTWEVEGGSASGIIGSGLTQEFLRSEPIIQVKGFRSKEGFCSARCRVAGEEFEFGTN